MNLPPRNSFRITHWILLAILFCCVTINNSARAQPQDPGPIPPKPVERISREALSQLFGGPILVTLQFQNSSAQEVFNALSEQAEKAGLKLRVDNEMLLAQQGGNGHDQHSEPAHLGSHTRSRSPDGAFCEG